MKHYKRREEKLTNWIDRKGYRPATIDDLNNGRSLKLQNSHVHTIYQLRNGIIKKFSPHDNRYIETTIEADFTLFCVLDKN